MKPQILKKVLKVLKELTKVTNRNAEHIARTRNYKKKCITCNKELDIIKIRQSKLDKSTAKVKTNLETTNSRLSKK